MTLVGSKTFIIHSQYCDGNPWDFTFNLPVGLVKCKENETMRVSIDQWSLLCSWNNVTDDNNTLNINNKTIVIPVGNYTLKQLAKVVNVLYAEVIDPLVDPTLVLEYDSTANRFVFTFSDVSSLSFQGSSYRTFGFSDGVEHQGTVIQSSLNIKPRLVDSFNVSIRGITPSDLTFENNTNGELTAKKYIVTVPITSPPFGMNVYRALKDGDASLMIQDKALSRLRIIVVETGTNNEASYIPHSDLVIKINTYREDNSNDLLSQLLEFQRLNFVSNGLAK